MIGAGCLVLVLAVLCGSATLCGGFTGIGAWFAMDQAREHDLVVSQAEDYVRAHPAVLAAAGGNIVSVGSDPWGTSITLGETKVALRVDGEQGEVLTTVYLRKSGDVWGVVGLEARGPGLTLTEGQVLDVTVSPDDWD